MRVTITGLEDLDRALAEAASVLDRAIADASARSIAVLGPALQRETPVRTGFLRASEDLSQYTPDSVTFEASAHYASFVNDGTRFQRANPFVERAVDAARPGVEGVYADEVDEFTDGFNAQQP